MSIENIPHQANWRVLVKNYQTSHTWTSIWQLCNTFIPFLLLWYPLYLSLEVGYWLTLLLSIPMSGLLIRIFIIQHDCGHGSFFKSRQANDWVGLICSVFTWTPYYYWQKSHAIHHAHAGNLAHRGIGDVYTMTVKEYLTASRWSKIQYRFYRNPIFLFVIVPMILFIVVYRFPSYSNKALSRLNRSVYATNVALVIVVGGAIWLVGLQSFLLMYIPIMIFATSAATWLFFVQHQFEETYWADSEAWDYTLAALQGSSYYKLPKVIQWFTGNIGFHHIHHLSPRIPNYLLEKCHNENPVFQETVTLTIGSSLKSSLLTLWDEDQKKLISFAQLRGQRRLANIVS
ncbi:MAG: fatty acid desaturase [Chloroflexota bacterium]